MAAGASLESCPRVPLGGAALGEMKPVDEPDEGDQFTRREDGSDEAGSGLAGPG